MFNSSYDLSRINPLSRSTSIEYFDDQDLSALQFWMFIGINDKFMKKNHNNNASYLINRSIDFILYSNLSCFKYYHLL